MTQFVYVMVDGYTGYYKIGRSVKPSNREATMLSQIPLLRLVQSWQSDKPSTDESFLHKRFADKHIRGEWFSLDENDVSEIHKFFEVGGAPILVRKTIPKHRGKTDFHGYCLVAFLKNYKCHTIAHKEGLCHSHYRWAAVRGLVKDVEIEAAQCALMLDTGRCKRNRIDGDDYCKTHKGGKLWTKKKNKKTYKS
jgi:hypothetical protein